jgi:hypothetical protein
MCIVILDAEITEIRKVRRDYTFTFPIITGIIVTVIALNFRAHRDGRVEIKPSYPMRDMPYIRDIRETTDVRVEDGASSQKLMGSVECVRTNEDSAGMLRDNVRRW